MRTRYVYRDGQFQEIGRDIQPKEGESAFVHQDTFKSALRHPKTGEMVESMSRWNAINEQHGLEIVGNDWVGKGPTQPADRITDEKILDKMEQAHAIRKDPTRWREFQAQNIERLEKFQRQQRETWGVRRID